MLLLLDLIECEIKLQVTTATGFEAAVDRGCPTSAI
jgi:hypothetical protein